MSRKTMILVLAATIIAEIVVVSYIIKLNKKVRVTDSNSTIALNSSQGINENPKQSASGGQGAAESPQGHTEATETQQQPEQQSQEETPTVEIPLDKQQMIGVKTVEVAIKPFVKTIRTVGRVEYDETKLATINTKVEGWIEKLYVDYTGRYVKRGEPLAEIYSPELFATQKELINTIKWAKSSNADQNQQVNQLLLKDADSMIEAARTRLKLWDITDEQIKKIEETESPIRTLTIYSPVNGYVVEKMAIQGMRMMPGEKLFDIADLSTVWILADVYEYDLALIKEGEPAKIVLSYFPNKEFDSRIEYVYPTLSDKTRTVKVRFSIQNADGELKPKMFTNVQIKIDLGKKLVIPQDSIIDTGARQVVYVDKGDGYFEPREIKIGLRADEMVEVLKGLKEGEKVAASGTFLIDSEAVLKGVTPLEQR